ncbi:hypothetical protein IC620_02090 [Hazenella sp. IB182357]|uniref:Bacterial toxin 44 domain-containing protein n=1 Tax=Polycladospora coralii TaxID=2771432 RepID=A0A926N4W8_9BACL|nr:hypothetical protein [Polycladospora coralii]MBS7530091.1 hypothetical protein [Polycladospora coralii]
MEVKDGERVITENIREARDYKNAVGKDIRFAYKNRPGGPWDPKEMKDFIGKEILVHGKFYNPADFGNIHFGVMAKVAGFTLDEAISGANVAQAVSDPILKQQKWCQ